MSVSISEIIAGASVHAVPLAGECAGYLVLAAADQAVAAPRRIGPAEVHLFGDGTVRVDGARAAAEEDSEADLRALLDALLMSASSATPALLRASRRASGRGIAALVREIETALIPVNRSAAHRALARLERETERARHSGRLDAAPPPAAMRSEPVKVTPPVRTPEPSPSEPKASSDASELLLAALPEIPSLLTPSVDAIAAYAAEIETRPEPIVVRRSAPPPARTPSPPALPVAGPRLVSPPPPVAEAHPTTPVFGTLIQNHSDDEMDIEVVFDDDLADDELTGVLPRSVPLEVSAMLESPIGARAAALADLTEPSPPVLEDEPGDTSALSLDPESASVLALVAEGSSPEPSDEEAEPSIVEAPPVAEASSVSEEPLAADALSAAEEPSAADAPPAAEEPFVALLIAEPSPVELLAFEAPLDDELPAEMVPVTEMPAALEAPLIESVSSADEEPFVAFFADEGAAPDAKPLPEPSVAMPAITADVPPVAVAPHEAALAEFDVDLSSDPLAAEPFEGPGMTQALALAIEPVVELPPAPRLPLPKPRPSDVEDLLGRMAEENAGASDELRSSLKGLAGIEPTPPPPET